MASIEELSALIAARLRGQRDRLAETWSSGGIKFARHVVIDDLLPEGTAMEIYERFPKDGAFWRRLGTFRERKKTYAKLDTLDPLIANITDAFQTRDVLSAAAAITGFDDLEADPSLYAGGISLMNEGDFLNPHIDNSHDAGRRRYRRLNLLFYISPDWSAENGGNFELWDKRVATPLEIVSRFNRLVIMETDKSSWHSVNPVRAPKPRCCVSNYYFSPSSPDGSRYYHVTSFLGRPGQPLRRVLGRLDNLARQTVASTLNISRGRKLGRYQ